MLNILLVVLAIPFLTASFWYGIAALIALFGSLTCGIAFRAKEAVCLLGMGLWYSLVSLGAYSIAYWLIPQKVIEFFI